MTIALNRLDPSLPDPIESRRRAAGRLVRTVYGTCILGLIAILVVWLGAPLVFLAGEGIVSARRQVVSLPITVQVMETRVAPGDAVGAGTEIARVRSPQHDGIIAGHLRALAEIAGREAELRIRARVAQESLEAARIYLGFAEEAVTRVEATAGAASIAFRLDLLKERAQARKALVSHEAEASEATTQITVLGALHQQIQERFDAAERNFADGSVRAPVAGIVAQPLAQTGQSLVAGTAIAEIFDTQDVYVDWHVPNRRLVDPKVGNAVLVLFGSRRITGTVVKLLPLADALAPRPGGTGRASAQVARIRLAPDADVPALNSTVTIHMHYASAVGRMAETLVDLLGLR
jgi:multidrug resistance efflux pump